MTSIQLLIRRTRSTKPALVAAVALATSAACITAALIGSDKDRDNDDDGGVNTAFPTVPHFATESKSSAASAVLNGYSGNSSSDQERPLILASSPISHNEDLRHFSSPSPHRQSQTNDHSENNEKPQQRVECDYVIIGHGKAGQSAVRTIQQLEPSAHIVIVDPNNTNSSPTKAPQGIFSTISSSGSIHHFPTRANFIDHSQRLIHVASTNANNNATSSSKANNTDSSGTTITSATTSVIHYRKSALLATGSRGAPPPQSCVRPDAWSRIFELRSTSAATSLPQTVTSKESIPAAIDPPTVRAISTMAASQGATVAIMGSGFEALELAAHCARVSSSSAAANAQNQSAKKYDTDTSKKVLLLFGNSSPMSNHLPRYLSAAVSRRLRQNGIEVEERAMTRYISMDRPVISHKSASVQEGIMPRLELYTVKSYDTMDSKRMLADMLVLAPSVDGLNGTAVIPTLAPPSSYSSKMAGRRTNMNQYLPWSSLISPPLLTCYLDDGRIATNPEFNAASSLYAAGSVAKYPNGRTGRAEVAGGRHVSAEVAGETAARNMVGSTAGMMGSRGDGIASRYIHESIPVLRSDVIPYLPAVATTTNITAATDRQRILQESVMQPNNPSTSLALYSMGIHALCIGRCDSVGMATHGFWWTNTSSSNQQSNSHEAKNGNGNSSGDGSSSSSSSSKTMGPNAFMRRATRRMTTNRTGSSTNSKGSSSRGSYPVYGSGVVFYLDRSGNIEGVMLWGLPYTSDSKNVLSEQLNKELVGRMKNVIRSNGGVSIIDHSEKILRDNSGLNLDVGVLGYLHLVEESKHLASIALTGSTASLVAPQELAPADPILPSPSVSSAEGSHKQLSSRKVCVLGRPLHRYTPMKSVELTNLGKLSRKDETGHLAEEGDLFYTSTASATTPETPLSYQRVQESGRPPSLKRIYPIGQGGNTSALLVGTSEYELERELERQRLEIQRSRPPKEEPLWLRQGEEHRLVNKKDAMAGFFLRNLQSGRFSDGKDAVRQAPAPQAYVEAKETWNSWTANNDGEEKDVDE